MHVCVACVCLLDPLELVLRIVGSHYVGDGELNPGPLQEQVLLTNKASL